MIRLTGGHLSRIHQLERKAIFSKSWILVTHTSRFAKEGDYVSFEIANFP